MLKAGTRVGSACEGTLQRSIRLGELARCHASGQHTAPINGATGLQDDFTEDDEYIAHKRTGAEPPTLSATAEASVSACPHC